MLSISLAVLPKRRGGCVSRMMEGVFDSNCGDEDDEEEDTKCEWYNISSETKEKWKATLCDYLAETKLYEMKTEGWLCCNGLCIIIVMWYV